MKKEAIKTLLIIAVIVLAIVSFILIVLFIDNVQKQVKYDNLVKNYNDLRETAIGGLETAEDIIQEYLITHDCYERGYFANKFCYDNPCITQKCEAGYKLACIPK